MKKEPEVCGDINTVLLILTPLLRQGRTFQIHFITPLLVSFPNCCRYLIEFGRGTAGRVGVGESRLQARYGERALSCQPPFLVLHMGKLMTGRKTVSQGYDLLQSLY